jgi:hypothetical protein
MTKSGRTRVAASTPGEYQLSTQSQLVDQGLVATLIVASKVVEQAPSLAHEHEQPAARVMVLYMDLQMFGELGDALAEERDLHFARPGVAGLALVLAYDLVPAFGVKQVSTFWIRERV